MPVRLSSLAIVAVFSLASVRAVSDEWIPIGANTDSTSYWIRGASIREVDGLRRAWVLMSMAETRDGYQSAVSLDLFDCGEFRWRSMQVTMFTGPMGAGAVAFSLDDADGKWLYPIPGSIYDVIARRVCKADVSKR